MVLKRLVVVLPLPNAHTLIKIAAGRGRCDNDEGRAGLCGKEEPETEAPGEEHERRIAVGRKVQLEEQKTASSQQHQGPPSRQQELQKRMGFTDT